MTVVAIDIGVVNTAVRVENMNGDRILHSVFTPDSKGKWLDKLSEHFQNAAFIGVEKQVAMNNDARNLMKQVLWAILDSGTRAKWGTISPSKKTPKGKLSSQLFTMCTNSTCPLKKTFHNDRDTKTWAVGIAGHLLLSRGESDNPIFTEKKKDDLADVVLYCAMMRSELADDKLITQVHSSTVAKMLALDLSKSSITDKLVARMSIAVM